MGISHLAVITLGALAGGFVSGLSGFGTGIAAIAIWLYVVPPPVAASLVVVCGVIAQLQSLPWVWRSIEARRVLPFIGPALFGIPVGTALLSHLDTKFLKVAIGLLLLVFSSYMLLRRRADRRSGWGGSVADGAIGFGGGVLGGLAGLSGVLPTMWATVRGWGRNESRGVFQAFNLTVLSVALLSYAVAGLLTSEVGFALLAALPGTISGAWLGVHAYGRVDDRQFRAIILVVLGISGGGLIWRSW